MKIRTVIRQSRTPRAATLGVLFSSALLSTAAFAQGSPTSAAPTNSTGGQGNTAQCSTMSGPERHSCERRMRADSQPTGVNSNSTTGADASIPGATPTTPGSQTLQKGPDKDLKSEPARNNSNADANRRTSSSTTSTSDASNSQRTRVSQRDQNATAAPSNTGNSTNKDPNNSTDAAATRTATELGTNTKDANTDDTNTGNTNSGDSGANDSGNRDTTNSRPRPSDDASSTSGPTPQSTRDSAQQDRARSRPNENSQTSSPR